MQQIRTRPFGPKAFATFAGLCLVLVAAYVALTVLREPPILQVAKIATIQDNFSIDRDRFDRQLREIFPEGTSEEEFLNSLKYSGFTIKQTPPKLPGADTRHSGGVVMFSGLNRQISIAAYDVIVVGEFKNKRLLKVWGSTRIQTY